MVVHRMRVFQPFAKLFGALEGPTSFNKGPISTINIRIEYAARTNSQLYSSIRQDLYGRLCDETAPQKQSLAIENQH